MSKKKKEWKEYPTRKSIFYTVPSKTKHIKWIQSRFLQCSFWLSFCPTSLERLAQFPNLKVQPHQGLQDSQGLGLGLQIVQVLRLQVQVAGLLGMAAVRAMPNMLFWGLEPALASKTKNMVVESDSKIASESLPPLAQLPGSQLGLQMGQALSNKMQFENKSTNSSLSVWNSKTHSKRKVNRF